MQHSAGKCELEQCMPPTIWQQSAACKLTSICKAPLNSPHLLPGLGLLWVVLDLHKLSALVLIDLLHSPHIQSGRRKTLAAACPAGLLQPERWRMRRRKAISVHVVCCMCAAVMPLPSDK